MAEKSNAKEHKIPDFIRQTRIEWAANDAKRDAGLTEPDDVVKYRDISYGPHGTWNLLDVYRPLKKEGQKLPVIVNIHGGGYFYGDKELYRFYAMHLAQFGFAVVNFNYRLAPESHFPAPLEDACGVFQWMAANAKAYGLDTGNVFLIGDSAGAQLASQFACICSNDKYARVFGFQIPKSVRVRGVSLACGLYDLRSRVAGDEGGLMLNYFGEQPAADDPRTDVYGYITKKYPPAYVFSAVYDSLKEDCRPFAAFLTERGVTAKAKVYGRKCNTEAVHVFHVNIRLPIAERCNRDQIKFFKALVK